MLRLEAVNENNREEILALRVSENQKTFVADNALSLKEAALANSSGGAAFPFGIYDDDKAVGFLMIGFGTDDSWEDPPEIAEDTYNLWRLMIDERYQGQGYGRQAVQLALDFIRTYPCKEAELCWLSYEPENINAARLYRSFGFTETGEMDGEEKIAVLRLK